MASKRDSYCTASQSARALIGMMPLALITGALAACESEQHVDADPRVFVAVEMPPLTSDRASTGGISFVDYDSDGDPDIYVTNGYDVSSPEPYPQANRLYENSGGHFEARSIEGLDSVEGFSSGSAWADFDNDGDLDSFIANQGDQKNLLLLQEVAKDGTMRFVRHATARLAEDKGWSYSIAAADADNDGFVDYYVSNGGLSHSGVNFLYRNLEGTAIQRVLNTDAVDSNHASGGASWSDYDGDGDQDLVVANRPTAEMQGFKLSLYRNDGNLQFTRMDEDALPIDATFPMSVAWGDVDNDGDQDLYAGNLYGMANNLYENLGDGTFRVMDGGRATTDAGSSYAVTFGDLDNDADLDLVVANWGGASEIYLNNGAGHFEQIHSREFRRSIHYASSLALGDYDRDGDLDILIGNWPNHPGEGFEENVLIENRFADGNWIRVALEGDTSNRSAIGALIVVETATEDETRQQIREVSTHSGWRSQSELTQHFGLGNATAVSKVVINWPSGNSQTIVGPPINQVLHVREGR
ncbi:MAG: CRTAC1 family protein [Gammaproteobacteria bacterium]|nr:CRTAC1 family protein [Gammaproteobacteria bacterium]